MTTTAAPVLSSGAVSETVMRDSRRAGGLVHRERGLYTIDQQVSIHCSASDPVPGSGSLGHVQDLDVPAWSLALGSHTLSATADDVAGNLRLRLDDVHRRRHVRLAAQRRREFSSTPKSKRLNHKLDDAEQAKTAAERAKKLNEFEKKVGKRAAGASRRRRRGC